MFIKNQISSDFRYLCFRWVVCVGNETLGNMPRVIEQSAGMGQAKNSFHVKSRRQFEQNAISKLVAWCIIFDFLEFRFYNHSK